MIKLGIGFVVGLGVGLVAAAVWRYLFSWNYHL